MFKKKLYGHGVKPSISKDGPQTKKRLNRRRDENSSQQQWVAKVKRKKTISLG